MTSQTHRQITDTYFSTEKIHTQANAKNEANMSRLVRINKRLMEALPSSEIFRKRRKIYAVEGKPEQKTRKPCKRRQGRLVPEQPEDEGGDQKQDRTQ